MAVPPKPTLLQRVRRWWALRSSSSNAAGDELGRLGEAAAEQHVRRLGWDIVARNARAPMGEADLLARDVDGVFVVLEVKSRVVPAHASALAALTVAKRRKLRAIAHYFAKCNCWKGVRIDAVAVEFERDHAQRLHLRGCTLVRGIA